MGFLDEQVEEVVLEAPQITIFGEPGTGKTTLAASFPNPLFIRAEDGMASVAGRGVKCLKLVSDVEQLWQQLTAVLKENHDFKTLVIDSVSALDRLFAEDVLKTSKAPTLNQALGGYGAGFNAVADRHARVKRACDMINTKRGMNIVYLSHSEVENMDPPDRDPYTRYGLRMLKKSAAVYIDGVDIVGFLALKTFVSDENGKGTGKAKSTGTRELICHTVAANVSKNRYGISKPITVVNGQNPLAPWAFHGETETEVKETE